MNAHRRAQPFVHQPPPQQRPVGSASASHQAATKAHSTAIQNGPMRQQQQPNSPPIPTHDPTRKRPQFLADELFQPSNRGKAHTWSHQQQQDQQLSQSYLFGTDPTAPSFSNAAPAASRINQPSFANPSDLKPPQHQQPQDPSQWSLSDLLANILRDKETVTIIDFLSTVIDHERLYDVTLVEDSFMNMLFSWTEENDCADMPMSQEDLLLLLDQLKEVNQIKDDDNNAGHAHDQQQHEQERPQQQAGGEFVDQRFFTIMSPGTPAAKQFSALTPAKQRMFMQIVTPLSMRKCGIQPPTRQPVFGGGASGIPKPTTFESRIPPPTAFGAAPSRPSSGAVQSQAQNQQEFAKQRDRRQQWPIDPAAKETQDIHSTNHQRAPSDIAITKHHPQLGEEFWQSDQVVQPPAFPPPAADGQGQQRLSPLDQPDGPLRYHDLFGPDIPAPAEMDNVPSQHQQNKQQSKYALHTTNNTTPDNVLVTGLTTLPTRNAFLARGTAAERDLLLEYETQIQTLNQHVSALKSQVQQYKKELAEAAEHEAQIMTAIDEFHAHARKLKRKAQWYHDELNKARTEVDEAVRREEALMGKVDELEREAREAREREAGMQDEYRQVVEEWRAVLAEREELQVMLHEARKEGSSMSLPPSAAGGRDGGNMSGPSGGRQFADAGAGSMSLGAELISGTRGALTGNMDPDTALRIGRLEAENEQLRRQVNAQGASQGDGRNLIPKVHAEVQVGKSVWDSEGLPIMRDANVMVRPDRYPCGTQYMDPEQVAQLAEMGIIEDEPDTLVSGLHGDDEMGGEGFDGVGDFSGRKEVVGLSVVPEGEEELADDRMDAGMSADLPDPLSPTPVRVAGPGGSVGGRSSSLFGRHRVTFQQPFPKPSAASGAAPFSSPKPSPHKSDRPNLMSQAGLDKALSLRERIKSLSGNAVLGKPGYLLMALVALALIGAMMAAFANLTLRPLNDGGSGFGELGPDFVDDVIGSHVPLIESPLALDPGYYCLIGIRQRVDEVADAAGRGEF